MPRSGNAIDAYVFECASEVPLSYTRLGTDDARLKPIPLGWSVFLRLQFDARYFFGSREDLSTLKKGP